MERRSNTKFKQNKCKSGAPFMGMFGFRRPNPVSKRVHDKLHQNMDNSDSNNNNNNEDSVKAVTPVKPGKAPVSKKEE